MTHPFEPWCREVHVAGVAFQVGIVGLPTIRARSEPFGFVRKAGVILWQRPVPPSADVRMILALAGVAEPREEGRPPTGHTPRT